MSGANYWIFKPLAVSRRYGCVWELILFFKEKNKKKPNIKLKLIQLNKMFNQREMSIE